MVHCFVEEAIVCGNACEFAVFQAVQSAAVCADPQGSLPVFMDCPYHIASQTIFAGVGEDGERCILAVGENHAVQAAFAADPQVSLLVLVYYPYIVINQTLFCGIYGKFPVFHPGESTAECADPQVSLSIFTDGSDHITG